MMKRLIALLIALAVILSVLAAAYVWFQKKSPPERPDAKADEVALLDELDRLYSDKELGAILDKENTQTVFRVFSPRATAVEICLFDAAEVPLTLASNETETVVAMQSDEQGVWEARLDGLLAGEYYLFKVSGPEGAGEGFAPDSYVGDPYARAVAHARNSCIVVDPAATNEWFAGWTDSEYTQTEWERTVIYTVHVRDFTVHPSSGVGSGLRGKYPAITATTGTGAGLDHVRKLGVNTLEFMPVAEFANGTDSYSWGYTPSYHFAPEASYGTAPLKGSQYYEFKQLVDDLHGAGVGIVLDVVFTHLGEPNTFSKLDRKYYFRRDQEHHYTDSSGGGNDLRTEAPMLRRLILDNIRYWMEEFHIDGFRIDQPELIDMKTLMAVAEVAREINPKVLLIAEAGDSPLDRAQLLADAGWQIPNGAFPDSVKRFAKGEGGRDAVVRAISGSRQGGTANPMQTVNYLASQTDMTLADELLAEVDSSGIMARDNLRRNSLAATMLFMSKGIPMLNAGQDFLRSKGGLSDTSDRPDRINAIDWNRRRLRLPNLAMRYYRGLIKVRNSQPGASLRLPDIPQEGYREWLLPENENLLGYFVNKSQTYPGASFLVLLNTSKRPVYFDVEFTRGRWRLFGDGLQMDPRGLPGSYMITHGTEKSVLLPGLSSRIFMRIAGD